MLDAINFFAYSELVNQTEFKRHGLTYYSHYPVTLSAWKLVFNKIPADNGGIANLGLPNIIPAPDNLGMMIGVLYELDPANLPKLDEIHQHPQEYTRKTMEFTRHDFTSTKAYVYLANPDKTCDGLRPSKALMQLYKNARKNFDQLYFSRLMNTPTAG